MTAKDREHRIDTGSPQLLPCPFCGSRNIADDDYIRDGKQVSCRECFASTIAYNPKAREKAIAAWNRRTK